MGGIVQEIKKAAETKTAAANSGSASNYNIDYNDKRFAEVEADKNAALRENENAYSGMINSSDKYYQDQIKATKDWANKQTQLQQEQTDFAIEQIEQQKAQANTDYQKEQSGAYVDWQKQSNQYGANAEQMAAMGMSKTGYSESAQVAMYNTYQNRVATARESYNRAVLNYDNAIKDARLQNNAALAEIAYNSLQQQLELSLQGFQYKNQLILDKANKKLEIDDMYYNRYKDVLNQINTENALAEEVRQYNESMAEDIRQYNASLAENKRQFNVSFAEDKRQYEKSFAENQRQYNASLAEDKRQYNASLAEDKRQYDKSFAENQRQYNTSLAEEKRQYDKSYAENKRQFEESQAEKIRQYNASLAEEKRQFEESQKEKTRQFNASLEEDKRQFNASQAAKKNSSASGSSSGSSKISSSKKSSSSSSNISSSKTSSSGSSSTSKTENKVDMNSVLNLGYGPISAQKLDSLVASGQVKEYVENGVTKFSNNKSVAAGLTTKAAQKEKFAQKKR